MGHLRILAGVSQHCVLQSLEGPLKMCSCAHVITEITCHACISCDVQPNSFLDQKQSAIPITTPSLAANQKLIACNVHEMTGKTHSRFRPPMIRV